MIGCQYTKKPNPRNKARLFSNTQPIGEQLAGDFSHLNIIMINLS